VSAPVAQAMAAGVRQLINASIAVSVTGLAGPGGDKFGNPVGTVFIGFESDGLSIVKQYRFSGDRESVRRQAVEEALKLILENA
jgi:PncC family amidohydrolase